MRLFSIGIVCISILSIATVIVLLSNNLNCLILNVLLIISIVTNCYVPHSSIQLSNYLSNDTYYWIPVIIGGIYSIYILICGFFYIFFIITYFIANPSLNTALLFFLVLFMGNIVFTGIIVWNLCCEQFIIYDNKVKPIHTFTDIVGVVNTKKDIVCTVCTDTIKIDLSSPIIEFTTCDHKFHHQCIMPWIRNNQSEHKNITCPNCRIILS